MNANTSPSVNKLKANVSSKGSEDVLSSVTERILDYWISDMDSWCQKFEA